MGAETGAMRTARARAMASAVVAAWSSRYCTSPSSVMVGRASGGSGSVSGRSSTSTTRPASLMPPLGSSRPYWLKVRLARRLRQAAGIAPGSSTRARFSTLRLFTSTSPRSSFQS